MFRVPFMKAIAMLAIAASACSRPRRRRPPLRQPSRPRRPQSHHGTGSGGRANAGVPGKTRRSERTGRVLPTRQSERRDEDRPLRWWSRS